MPCSPFNSESESACLRAAPADRHAAGRSRRETVPLEALVEAAPATGRADPLAILAEQDKTRLADLVPIRYGRMSRTPFTFLRGAAAVMASDLAAGARTDLRVELCGDAHLGNFRWYCAPNRELVFDLNDFDETLPGPFEWDVKRLAASVTVAARANGFSGRQASDALSDAGLPQVHRQGLGAQSLRAALLPFRIAGCAGTYREARQAASEMERGDSGEGHSQQQSACLRQADRCRRRPTHHRPRATADRPCRWRDRRCRVGRGGPISGPLSPEPAARTAQADRPFLAGGYLQKGRRGG